MSSTAPPQRATIYERISEADADDRSGIERHIKEDRELAEKLGWQVAHVLSDHDISAYSGKRRPDYEKLLDLIRTGQTDGVITWHTDRMHRNPGEQDEYIKLCKRHGIQTVAVRVGTIDFSTASGEFNARVMGLVNYFESQHKAERVRSKHRELAEQGKWHGGIRCFGYEPDGMTVREDEAAEIKRLAEAVIRGQSLRSLAIELNERRVPTVKGKRWSSAHLGKMLARPRLAGLRQHNDKIIKCETADGKARWPAILDRETWEAVKDILEDPSRCTGGSGRRGPVPTTLGTGLYVCGVCSQPRMRLGRSTARRPVYKCGNAATSSQGHVCRVADKLDAFVEGALLQIISRPGVVEAMCNMIDTGDDTELAALRSEQATIRPRLNKAAKRYEADEIDDEQLAIISRDCAPGITRSPRL
jgi:site-specific DNA recombinase